MSKKHKQIVIRIPSSILEIEELNHLEKLMLSVTYTFSKKKLGFNSLSNKEFSEMLGVDTNSLGKHRNNLLKLGLERKEKGKYYLTDKVDDRKVVGKRDILLPSQVYTLRKLKSGAKLLWGEYNSLEKGSQGFCIAKRETLANRLQCSEDSITNWHNKLNEKELLSYSELLHGKNTKQRKVKTKKFGKNDNKEVSEEGKVQNTALELSKKDDAKGISKNVKKKLKEKIKIQSVEHSVDEMIWKKYMSDIHLYDLNSKVDREDCVWSLCESIEINKDDKQAVLTSILENVDKYLKDTVGVILLKEELKYYLEDGKTE